MSAIQSVTVVSLGLTCVIGGWGGIGCSKQSGGGETPTDDRATQDGYRALPEMVKPHVLRSGDFEARLRLAALDQLTRVQADYGVDSTVVGNCRAAESLLQSAADLDSLPPLMIQATKVKYGPGSRPAVWFCALIPLRELRAVVLASAYEDGTMLMARSVLGRKHRQPYLMEMNFVRVRDASIDEVRDLDRQGEPRLYIASVDQSARTQWEDLPVPVARGSDLACGVEDRKGRVSNFVWVGNRGTQHNGPTIRNPGTQYCAV